MKVVVYVSATDELGGSDASLFELVSCLDRTRFLPVVVLPHEGPFAARYRGLGVEVVVVPLKKLKNTRDPLWHLAWIARAPARVVRLLRLFRRLRPEIVHLNSSVEALAGIAARAFCSWTGARLVWHVRELELRPLFVEKAIFWLVARWADAVVAISTPIAERFSRRERVWVIPNGLEVARFAGTGRPARSAPTLGWVGRLAPGKGLENVLQAFRLVRRVVPYARLIVVAAEHDEHSGYAKALRESVLDLGDWIEWQRGSATPERAYERMDLFVHLPDLQEGLGRTVLEAQAAGVPVLCWPRGGLVDAVRDGETGCFVSDGDVPAAALAVIELLSAPERRRALGARAARHAEDHFTNVGCARRVEAAYEEILR